MTRSTSGARTWLLWKLKLTSGADVAAGCEAASVPALAGGLGPNANEGAALELAMLKLKPAAADRVALPCPLVRMRIAQGEACTGPGLTHSEAGAAVCRGQYLSAEAATGAATRGMRPGQPVSAQQKTRWLVLLQHHRHPLLPALPVGAGCALHKLHTAEDSTEDCTSRPGCLLHSDKPSAPQVRASRRRMGWRCQTTRPRHWLRRSRRRAHLRPQPLMMPPAQRSRRTLPPATRTARPTSTWWTEPIECRPSVGIAPSSAMLVCLRTVVAVSTQCATSHDHPSVLSVHAAKQIISYISVLWQRDGGA